MSRNVPWGCFLLTLHFIIVIISTEAYDPLQFRLIHLDEFNYILLLIFQEGR